MVDVTQKAPTVRPATAGGFVRCSPAVVAALRGGTVPKGGALAVARVADIAGAKRCPELPPLSRVVPELTPLVRVIAVHAVSLDLDVTGEEVAVGAAVRALDRTGVESEAPTAVSVAALAPVDMAKGLTRSVSTASIVLRQRVSARTGTWRRDEVAR
jgi:cyclic pyranopterin phosphate synthase